MGLRGCGVSILARRDHPAGQVQLMLASSSVLNGKVGRESSRILVGFHTILHTIMLAVVVLVKY